MSGLRRPLRARLCRRGRPSQAQFPRWPQALGSPKEPRSRSWLQWAMASRPQAWPMGSRPQHRLCRQTYPRELETATKMSRCGEWGVGAFRLRRARGGRCHLAGGGEEHWPLTLEKIKLATCARATLSSPQWPLLYRCGFRSCVSR
eukprot:3000486-Alexandrium_andersonii.AAC.1